MKTLPNFVMLKAVLNLNLFVRSKQIYQRLVSNIFWLVLFNIIEIFCHCLRGVFRNVKKSFLPYVIIYYNNMLTNCRKNFRVQIITQFWAAYAFIV